MGYSGEVAMAGPGEDRDEEQGRRESYAGLLFASLCQQTYFVPDEYWQAPEVAHRLSFGYGYLTWEWREGIRSYAIPFLMSLLYNATKFLSLDDSMILELIPKLSSAFVAIMTDLALMQVACKCFGVEVAFNAIICQVSSCMLFYCMSRSLVNSVETCLITAILALWPWEGQKDKSVGSPIPLCWLLTACVLIRPTSILMFLPLICRSLYTLRDNAAREELQRHLMTSITHILVAGSVFIGLDSYHYGRFVLSSWNFFYFNAVQGGGSMYGSHAWWWYLSEGIPTLLMTSLPLVVYGMRQNFHRELLECVCLTTAVHRTEQADEIACRCGEMVEDAGNAGWDERAVSQRSMVGGLLRSCWFMLQRSSQEHLSQVLVVSEQQMCLMITSRFFEEPNTFLDCAYGDKPTAQLPSHIVMFGNLEECTDLKCVFENLTEKAQERLRFFLSSRSYNMETEIFHTHIPLEVCTSLYDLCFVLTCYMWQSRISKTVKVFRRNNT
eukprot:451050-Hanusia_phi.AAC.1